jgi:hypothetical protein
MKRRFSISFELSGDGLARRYYSLALWLCYHDAIQVMPTEWILLIPLTIEEITREIRAYLDPADRLLVKQVTSMSSQNLINDDNWGRGAA